MIATVTPKDVLDFLVVTVFFKYVFVHGTASIINWGAKRMWKWVKGHIIITERDMAVYWHYRRQALKRDAKR